MIRFGIETDALGAGACFGTVGRLRALLKPARLSQWDKAPHGPLDLGGKDLLDPIRTASLDRKWARETFVHRTSLAPALLPKGSDRQLPS